MIDRRQASELLRDRRTQLEQLRRDLDLSRAGEQEDLSALSTIDQHPADIGTETFDREADYSLLQQVEGELHRVDEAEQRLINGTYGFCEVCGRPIEESRLEVMPETTRCIEHAGSGSSSFGRPA